MILSNAFSRILSKKIPNLVWKRRRMAANREEICHSPNRWERCGYHSIPLAVLSMIYLKFAWLQVGRDSCSAVEAFTAEHILLGRYCIFLGQRLFYKHIFFGNNCFFEGHKFFLRQSFFFGLIVVHTHGIPHMSHTWRDWHITTTHCNTLQRSDFLFWVTLCVTCDMNVPVVSRRSHIGMHLRTQVKHINVFSKFHMFIYGTHHYVPHCSFQD